MYRTVIFKFICQIQRRPAETRQDHMRVVALAEGSDVIGCSPQVPAVLSCYSTAVNGRMLLLGAAPNNTGWIFGGPFLHGKVTFLSFALVLSLIVRFVCRVISVSCS